MKLNLGCGRDIRKGYVNLDSAPLKGVDAVHDMDKFPYPFKDNQFTEVIANHVLEHVQNLMKVMQELSRICKPNAIIKVRVPFYHSHGAFQDPTHKIFFTMDTFDYFTHSTFFDYYAKAKFVIVKREPIPTSIGKLVP